jgi:2-dehydro-3-deoxygalactonokinase
MRFIIADWGTTRFRAYLLENGAILDRVASDEGVSALKAGEHQGVFRRQVGHWLAAEPEAPVALVGMVGSREGWVMAPYAACPAGPADLARAMIPIELGNGRQGRIVPGITCEPRPGAVDVMRGEETLVFGTGVEDGLICLPGTHPKWVEVKGGRIQRFATFFTGEMYALLRHHSMAGRPATEPEDPSGFQLGLDAAEHDASGARAGLLHLIFGARAATVTGRLAPERLGPYLSGLVTGAEIDGALSLFTKPAKATIVAAPARAHLFAGALGRHRVETAVIEPEQALIAGLSRILGSG